MYEYTWYQWLSFFYIYCFFGWIFESTYVSLKQHRFVNRGFLRPVSYTHLTLPTT